MSINRSLIQTIERSFLRDWRNRPMRVAGAVGALLLCTMLFGVVFTLTGSIERTLGDGTATNLRDSPLLARSLSPSGLTTKDIADIEQTPGVEKVVGVLVVAARVTGKGLSGNVMLAGSDSPRELFESESSETATELPPDSLILTRPLADDLGVRVGDVISLNTPTGVVERKVIEIVRHKVAFAISELASVSRLWQRSAAADLVFIDTTDVAAVKKVLVSTMPPTVVIGNSEDLASTEVSTLMFVRVLLQVVTVLTAFLAAVAIFTAWRMTVLDQSTNIARLRLSGVSTKDILLASGSIAVIACSILSVIGSIVGALMGRQLDPLVAKLAGVSGLSARPSAGPTLVPVIIGTTAGVLVGILGWFAGTRSLRRISLAQALRPASTSVNVGKGRRVWPSLMVLILATSLGLLSLKVDAIPIGLVALLLLGAAFLAGRVSPSIAGYSLGSTLKEPSRTLSAASLRGDRGHLTTVATLTVMAVILLVSISGTITGLLRGLQTSVNAWTQADLYVEPALPGEYVRDEKFKAQLEDQIAGLPFVKQTGAFTLNRYDDGARPVQIQAWSRSSAPEFVNLAVSKGTKGPELWSLISSGKHVAVSVNYAALNKVDVGDTISLPGVRGVREFKVAALAIDFLSDGGIVYTDVETAKELTADDRINAVFVTLKPGSDPKEASKALEKVSKKLYPDSFVMTRSEMREYVVGLGRQLLSMLLLIAIAAAAMATVASVALIATSLTARERSLALLNLNGIPRKRLRSMLRREFMAVGIVAAVWGIVLGLVAQRVLGGVVEKAMGIRPSMVVNPALLGSGLLLGIAIPIISSLTTVRTATSRDSGSLLRDDR